MEALFTSEGLLALVTLTAMEIVLGIDNLVFIAILAAKLPPERQASARRTGLAAALVTRLALLFTISWMMGLTRPLFAVLGHPVSGRDVILLAGGLFLMFKAVWEIYDKVEAGHEAAHTGTAPAAASFGAVIVQIMLLDIVFSLDSVITAVGMASHIAIMVVAMVVAMLLMLLSMEGVSGFIERHPSVKLLALSFLLLIGVMLVADGMGRHIPKGYIYFAMAFSLLVEVLNMRYRRQHPVQLHRRPQADRH